jgi:NAD(P)-dependent dehydrogenase (short-subunit alcohol dehydrogenase family)
MEYNGFDENFSLAGKIALVTGAAAGIGEAIALMYGRKGADVILADMNVAAAESVAAKIRAGGRKALAVQCDVGDGKSIQSAVETAVGEFKRIDILVNCAGVGLIDDAENLSADFWNKTLAINLSGAFFMSQQVGRIMIKQKGGKIVNIASQAALVALDKHVAYTASKAGLVGVTKVLAYEWAEYNIQVNAISPTVILTELGKRAWAGEVGENFKKKLPAGRFGYPDEVAAAAVFLASDAANLITGENLVIDGGYTIQ